MLSDIKGSPFYPWAFAVLELRLSVGRGLRFDSGRMTQSRFKIGANIDRMVAQNEQYHLANQYDKRNKRMEQLSAWHSGKYRELKCPTQLMKVGGKDGGAGGAMSIFLWE
eukprot:4557621-Pyramimonas_sp.AAC.2